LFLNNPKNNPKTNAKWNPINNPKNNLKKKIETRREAIDLLTKLGKKDLIYSTEEVEQEVYDILHKKRLKLGQKSIMDLVDSDEPFSFYFGETEQRVTDEDLQFLGRRSANLPRKKDGEIPRNRPVLLRGDTKLPENASTSRRRKPERSWASTASSCSAPRCA